MAPKVVVPEMDKLVMLLRAPLTTALPEIVRALEPPAMEELVVIVVPCKVRTAPVPASVTGPV